MPASWLWLLACLAVLSPAPAVAQDSRPSPSADELWESYPLHQSPEPGSDPAGARSPDAPTPARPPAPAAPRSDDGGAPTLLLILVALLAATVALALLGWRRWRELRSAPRLPSAPNRVAAMRAPGGAPPDVRRAWTAEIEWLHTGGESRFCAMARTGDAGSSTLIAQSTALEWPPSGPKSVEALSAAASALEAVLVAAGWKPLPPGDRWYAKRFAWEPVDSAPVAEPAGRRAAHSGRVSSS